MAQQSPSNLNLKRSNQMVAEEEEDYTLPTSIPKRRRSSHRAPHQQHHNRAFLVHALEEDYFPLPAVSEGAPTGAAAAGGEEATDMEVEGDDIATSAAAATGGSAVDEAAAKVLYDMLCQGMAEGHQVGDWGAGLGDGCRGWLDREGVAGPAQCLLLLSDDSAPQRFWGW